MVDTANISILPLEAAAGRSAIALPQLLPQEAHIWVTRLDVPEQLVSDYAELLTSDESARAARFYFERHQNRFVVGRGVLRSLLAAYLHYLPEQIRFSYGQHGKPEVALTRSGTMAAAELGLAGEGLAFNLSHSEDLAVIAITRAGAVGVDVERVRRLPELDELVKRFFSAREAALFAQLNEADKPRAFFNLWTRKEAWLKATGDGIASLLSEVDVTFLDGEAAKLLGLPPVSHWRGRSPRVANCTTQDDWSLCDFRPAPGYAGAIAVSRPGISVRMFNWEHQDAGLEHSREVA